MNNYNVEGQATPNLSLRNNFIWIFIGNTVYAASQWGILIVLARLGNVNMVGQFALALAICTPVYMLANLELRLSHATDATNKFQFGEYLRLRLITSSGAIVIISVLALSSTASKESRLAIVLMGVAKYVESISDIIYGFFQKQERMHFIAKSMMIKGFSSVILMTAFLYILKSIIGAVGSLIIAWTTALILYDYKKYADNYSVSNNGRLSEFLAEMKTARGSSTLLNVLMISLPLGVVVGLVSLTQNIPRYFVRYYLGEASLGFYAAIAYVMVAEGTIVAALVHAVTPRLSRYFLDNIEAFKKLQLKILGIVFFIGSLSTIVAILFSRHILLIIYGQDYARHHYLLIWVMVAAGIWYLAAVLRYSATAARQFRAQAIAFTVISLIMVVSCVLLVPENGLIGAAWALGITSSAKLFAFIVINWRIIREKKKENTFANAVLDFESM